MERSASYPSQTGHGSDQATADLPPWDRRSIARVPYMSRDAHRLNDVERRALQSIRAANERGGSDLTRPRIHRPHPKSFNGKHPLSHHEGDELPTPRTALPFTTARTPPPLAATTPRHSPTFAHTPRSFISELTSQGDLPPTPPPDTVSLSRSSTTKSFSTTKSTMITSPGSSPRLLEHTIPTLPGTMSARESIVAHKPSSRSKREQAAKKDKPDSKSLGKRLRLAMKDILKRDPIDESQFEHISDRHWTDE